MKIILILLFLCISCQKDTQGWVCYKTTYTNNCTKCGDSSITAWVSDSLNIDSDAIAIFMSQNNYRDSIGNGYSWECKLR